MGGPWPLVIVSLSLAWTWIAIAREVLRCNRSAGLKNFHWVEVLNRLMDYFELRKRNAQQWFNDIWNGEKQPQRGSELSDGNVESASQGTSSEIAEPTFQQRKVQDKTVWDLTQGQVIWRIVVPSMMSALMLAIIFLRHTVSHWTLAAEKFGATPPLNPQDLATITLVGALVGFIVSVVVIGPRKGFLYLLIAAVAGSFSLLVAYGLEKALQHMGPENAEIARLYVAPCILLSAVLLVVLLIGLMGTAMIEQTREWLSRLGAWLGIAWFAWVGLKVLIFHGPGWINDLFGSAHRLKMFR